jgi:glyoxylase-like metal-dependent hydrolase (beta-lactamase superfamily II)
MDHAGLAGMLINHGVQFLIFKNQFFAIEGMEALIQRKGMDYTPIDLNRTISLDLSESRKWLQTIGVLGEIIQTNGHGEDHVSLILDSGEAFIGDLNPLEYVAIQDDPLTRSNWSELRKKGAKSIFPAHVEPFRMGKE